MNRSDIDAALGAIATWREALRGVRGPMGLADLARHAMALSEAVLADVREPVSCRLGCGACCRQVVPLTPAEALLLSEDLEKEPVKVRRRVGRRSRVIASKLRNAGLGEAPLFHHAADYFGLSMPCPYLVDEACSIHARRPFVCREHLAISPAENCMDLSTGHVRMLPLPFSLHVALADLTAECIGTGTETIPLVFLSNWSAANAEMASRTWDAEILLDRLAELCWSQLETPAPR